MPMKSHTYSRSKKLHKSKGAARRDLNQDHPRLRGKQAEKISSSKGKWVFRF